MPFQKPQLAHHLSGVVAIPEEYNEVPMKAVEEDFTVIQSKQYVHASAMSDEIRRQKQMNAEQTVPELFKDVMKSSGKLDTIKMNWVDDQTVEVGELSNLTLHSFILKAEELGKKITYTKTFSIKISD